MIVDAIASAVAQFIVGLLAVLPAASPLALNIGPAVSIAGMLNAGAPVTEMLAGAGILLGMASASFVFGLARQIWRFVPIIGGG